MFRSLKRLGAASVLIVAATACDFEVTNPGPTEDSFLDRPQAHQAVANGSARMVFDALNEVAYTTSAVTRELFPSGSTSSFGISQNQQAGLLTYDDEHIVDGWTSAQRARYIGESGFARFEETHDGGNNGYAPAVDAALYAAYANRLLGENWCEAAVDGGAIITRTEMLQRAETWFTTAIGVATTSDFADQKTAAYAGRASVRANLGDWAGALQDAAQVPTSFEFDARYETAQQDQFNRIYFAGASEPYRAVTVWNTKYVDYYDTTGDPRTPYTYNEGDVGDASVGLVGSKVPFYQQQKFNERGSDIRLSSGYEMRLLEAEKKLIDGDWAGAMTLVNGHRVALGLDPWTPASLDEAWAAYKRERGIELWLEGRRLSDLKRWKDNGEPGTLDVLETAGSAESYLDPGQSLCYPIPKDERESNPNIPLQPGG
jgi:hypothetical protein